MLHSPYNMQLWVCQSLVACQQHSIFQLFRSHKRMHGNPCNRFSALHLFRKYSFNRNTFFSINVMCTSITAKTSFLPSDKLHNISLRSVHEVKLEIMTGFSSLKSCWHYVAYVPKLWKKSPEIFWSSSRCMNTIFDTWPMGGKTAWDRQATTNQSWKP